MALFRVVWEYTALVMMIFTSPYRLGEYHHDACSIFSYNPQCHPILYNYYVLRIFHVYKCTVNENTNKSAYWYPSQKSSIPDFAKPGIVAEICPSGFVHSSYLPTDWLTLVWTHPLSQIGNTWVLLQHFCPIMKIGWFPSLVMVEFPVLFGSNVLLAQNHHFGWFRSFFMVHSVFWLQRVFHLKSSGWFPFYGCQCCLAQKCSLLKIISLGGSLQLLYFPVLVGS